MWCQLGFDCHMSILGGQGCFPLMKLGPALVSYSVCMSSLELSVIASDSHLALARTSASTMYRTFHHLGGCCWRDETQPQGCLQRSTHGHRRRFNGPVYVCKTRANHAAFVYRTRHSQLMMCTKFGLLPTVSDARNSPLIIQMLCIK